MNICHFVIVINVISNNKFSDNQYLYMDNLYMHGYEWIFYLFIEGEEYTINTTILGLRFVGF